MARSGRLDEAQAERLIVELTEAIRRDPKNGQAYLSRGQAYIQRKEYQKAVADYVEVIMLEPRNATAFFQLAKACVKIARILESSAPAKK